MAELQVSEVRASLLQVLDRVERGEEVTITRPSRAVAVMVPPDILRVRRASGASAEATRVAEVVRSGGHSRIPAGGGLAADRAEELVAEIRADRDAG